VFDAPARYETVPRGISRISSPASGKAPEVQLTHSTC